MPTWMRAAPNAEANARPLQTLSGAPAWGDPCAIDYSYSPTRSIALLGILVLACLLVATPATVAGLAMVDPGSLASAASWFTGFSPLVPHLEYVKVFMALVAVILVLKIRSRSRSVEHAVEAR